MKRIPYAELVPAAWNATDEIDGFASMVQQRFRQKSKTRGFAGAVIWERLQDTPQPKRSSLKAICDAAESHQ
ncbi:hypothetical protein [Rubripirellula reticaptiva]|uniref:hypothetical protein n=1 Tax=Rubripirellula reticaptiva TaxID=2528013 RepID=UPI0011B61B4B|nr:hypothetical protein [Rubripirellula reticaptiva]